MHRAPAPRAEVERQVVPLFSGRRAAREHDLRVTVGLRLNDQLGADREVLEIERYRAVVDADVDAAPRTGR